MRMLNCIERFCAQRNEFTESLSNVTTASEREIEYLSGCWIKTAIKAAVFGIGFLGVPLNLYMVGVLLPCGLFSDLAR